LIRINISETDIDQIVGTQTSTQEFSFSVSVSSTVGVKISLPGDIGSASSENKYSFTAGQKSTSTNTIRIAAKDLVNLGDFDLTYCADQDLDYQFFSQNNHPEIQNQQWYDVIDERNGFLNWWHIVAEE